MNYRVFLMFLCYGVNVIQYGETGHFSFLVVASLCLASGVMAWEKKEEK